VVKGWKYLSAVVLWIDIDHSFSLKRGQIDHKRGFKSINFPFIQIKKWFKTYKIDFELENKIILSKICLKIKYFWKMLIKNFVSVFVIYVFLPLCWSRGAHLKIMQRKSSRATLWNKKILLATFYISSLTNSVMSDHVNTHYLLAFLDYFILNCNNLAYFKLFNWTTLA